MNSNHRKSILIVKILIISQVQKYFSIFLLKAIPLKERKFIFALLPGLYKDHAEANFILKISLVCVCFD